MEHQNNWVAGRQDQAGLHGVGGTRNRGGNNVYVNATCGYTFSEIARAASAAATHPAVMGSVGTGALAGTTGAVIVGTGAIAPSAGAGAGAGAAVMDAVGTSTIARTAGASVGAAAKNAVGTGAIARAAGAGAAVMDVVGTGAIARTAGAVTGGIVTRAAGAFVGGTSAPARATGTSAPARATGAVAAGTSAAAGTKRGRRNLHTRHQNNVLEAFFKSHPRPREKLRNKLARCLGLEHDQVLSWFQNKRKQELKARKKRKQKYAALQAQNQQRTEPSDQTGSSREGDDAEGSPQPMDRNYILMENVRLREEVKMLRSTLASVLAGQNLPVTFQDELNLPKEPEQNPQQNLPILSQNQQNLHTIPQIPQNLPNTLVTSPQDSRIIFQNPEKRPVNPQDPQSHPIILSEVASNTVPCPSDPGPGVADNSITTSRDVLDSTNKEPTPARFRQSMIENLVVSAAEELKLMAFSGNPLWSPSSADGATSELDEMEYLAQIPNLFEPTRLAYTREASRHLATVLLNPRQLLDIFMNVNKWSFMFAPIVLRASTLEVLSEGVDYDAALHVMAAEYHLATPLVPNRKTYFARYCTKHEEGVWVVVDVSLDNILHTPDLMNCQKGPSGCLIQATSDGTSKITWIEHVYVDYSGVSTLYQPLLRSGFGFGAKRWVSTLERQCQRLATEISADILATQELNNLLMSRPQGRRGILKLAERMVSSFIFGIAGLNTGTWTQVHGDFGGDVRLMSTRLVNHPGLPNATVISVSTSFLLPFAPNNVFDFLRDHKSRKERNIFANENVYEPLCCISSSEHTSNCVTLYKVPKTTRPVHILLQESWSDAVASHIVFASTEIGSLDAILGGSSLDSLAILPSGFTILPQGSSFFTQGSSGTLLTASFQVLTKGTPVDAINCADVSTAVGYLRCSCQNIKHAFGVVDANT